jgi:hypothetical protein
LSASRRTTGAVAEVLNKERIVSLHSGCGRCVAITHCAVDHVKAWQPSLVQSQFEVGAAAPREVLRPPLNVEDTVGRSPTDRGKDAEPGIDQIQVVPIRVDGVVVGEPRQTLVGKGRIGRCELSVAVGRQIDRGKALIVQREWEGQRHSGDCIIPVITDVRGAWHDAAAYLTYHVRANARRGR